MPSAPQQPTLRVVPGDAGAATPVRGVVWWYCPDRGFGQLRTADGGVVFLSHRDIQCEGFRTVQADDEVEFVPSHDQHGPVATDIVVVRRSSRAVG